MVRPRIEVERVVKNFGPVTALEDLDLRVKAGEIYCLLGRNGAGKSTALNAVMGLTHPTSGELRIGGVNIRSPEIHKVRQSIGYLPQRSCLYEHLTGREFLRFIGGLYEVSRDAFRVADRRLDALEMTEAADSPIRTYSVGMRRKVGIVASILHEPSYLIFDEPTSSLDPASVQMIKEVMTDSRDQGRLVLLSTHRLDLAEQLADRLGILHSGRLAFEGSVQDLRVQHGRHTDETLESLFLRLTMPMDQRPVHTDRKRLSTNRFSVLIS